MGKIIILEPKDKEREFIESLSEWQLMTFCEIVEKARKEYEELAEAYEQKDIECLALRTELEIYKRGIYDT